MELQAVTGQLHIVNGALRQNASVPGLLARTAPGKAARGREQDLLFVHITLSGPPLEESTLLDDVVDSIATRFYQTPGSVTAALRNALFETNKRLLNYNLNSDDRPREGAVTCAVQRREELYIAQAGESIALVGHNFGIERLPPSPREQATPLGRSAGIDICLHHNRLQSSDMLLLADPRLAHLPTGALEPVLVDGDVENGTEELIKLVGSDSARVMLIEFTYDAPAYLPDVNPELAKPNSGRRLSPPIGTPRRERFRAPVGQDNQRFRSPFTDVDVEIVETSARRATSEAAKGLSRLTAWLANLMLKLRPPLKESTEHGGWAMPMFLAVGIPLAVAVVVAGVYFQRGSVVEISDLKSTMRKNLDLARQAGDDFDSKIGFYDEVLQLALEGLGLRPDDAEIVSIRDEAIGDLDEMEGVSRLKAQLLHRYQEGTELSSVALGDRLNGKLFTLDTSNDIVYLHHTGEDYLTFEEGDPDIVLSSEQPVGGHVVGDLIDIMWRPRGSDVSRDGVAVLDRGGILYSYHPNLSDTRAVPLGLASDWIQPSAMTGYFERAYVLDRAASEIWKYLPEGDGFILQEDERSIRFDEDVDIAHVVDLAIHSEDGSVVLLYDDGRIRRYANRRLLWDENSLYESGMNSRLVSPSSIKIAGRGLSSSIFVLDPEANRLVQLSHGGTFLAQFKIADKNGRELLKDAQDFSVADNPFRVFLVGDNRLYVAAQD